MNNRKDEADRWLRQARVDLDAARWAAKGAFYADACFKAQQGAEKALKAFLYSIGEQNVRGHSTWELANRIAEHADPDFLGLGSGARRLDKFYITSRYPDGLPSGTPHDYFEADEAEEAIAGAARIIEFVERKMEGASNGPSD